MNPDYSELRSTAAAAARAAIAELRQQFPNERLFGFALCTDDEVLSVYHVACTRAWVQDKEKGYPDIGFVYTEWVQSANEELFDSVCTSIATTIEEDYPDLSSWNAARDARYEAIVLGLKDCRDEGVFDEDTLVCFGSTDPSDELEALAMSAVDRLNPPSIADQFAERLGYTKYRRRA